DPAVQAEITAKEEARKHFDQGLALFDRGSLDAAYPEFDKSISIYPTRSAIKNAALCLRRLNRFAEAVDMNERLLAFPGVSEEERGIAQNELNQLRPVVGNIVVDGVQAGATVTIDSKPVGTTPLKGPVHVPVGTRVVRILKAGFETFEKRVEAAGGKEVTVRAVLAPLELSGWLSVDEASGYSVDVVLDGTVVGKTPWRGLIATGEHLVVLRGDKRQGTQPARIEVRQSQVTNMLVIAEDLASDLKVKSELPGADIRIDGVLVGHDSWEGPVRAGSHRVEIGGNGYAMAERRVDVAPGKTETLSFAPTVEAPRTFWEENPPFIEAGGAFALGPSFGGVAKDCTDCTRVMGGAGTVRGGLSIRNRWTVGFDLGFLSAQQTVNGRLAAIKPVGILEYDIPVNDVLSMSGFTAGVGLGVKFGDRFPIGFRLGVGGFFGSFSDHRSGEPVRATGISELTEQQVSNFPNPVPTPDPDDKVKTTQSFTFTAFYVMPEIRAGVRVKKNLDVILSLAGTLLVTSEPPRWNPDDSKISAGLDGLAKFKNEVLTNKVQFVGTPALLVNYRF
ncbi:MAG TPA: PEGA domain-containing protein, partial [Polyangium sp.]|nr:PEGA domain-containing protein [Polyangium sp.]